MGPKIQGFINPVFSPVCIGRLDQGIVSPSHYPLTSTNAHWRKHGVYIALNFTTHLNIVRILVLDFNTWVLCDCCNFGTKNRKLKRKADLKSFFKSESFQLFPVLKWLTGNKVRFLTGSIKMSNLAQMSSGGYFQQNLQKPNKQLWVVGSVTAYITLLSQ